MKDFKYFLNESIVNVEEYVECVNDYISDNWGAHCVKVLSNYKDTNNEFTKPKYGNFAYRGLFFNNMNPQKVEELIKTLPKKYKMDKIESWSTEWEEPIIFAGGKNVYDVDRTNVDEWDLASQLDETQCGVVLKMENLDTKDVLFDVDHYLQNSIDMYDIDVIEEKEIILKRKPNPKIYIYMLLYNGNVEYELD